jgi:hypothetical protein
MSTESRLLELEKTNEMLMTAVTLLIQHEEKLKENMAAQAEWAESITEAFKLVGPRLVKAEIGIATAFCLIISCAKELGITQERFFEFAASATEMATNDGPDIEIPEEMKAKVDEIIEKLRVGI